MSGTRTSFRTPQSWATSGAGPAAPRRTLGTCRRDARCQTGLHPGTAPHAAERPPSRPGSGCGLQSPVVVAAVVLPLRTVPVVWRIPSALPLVVRPAGPCASRLTYARSPGSSPSIWARCCKEYPAMSVFVGTSRRATIRTSCTVAGIASCTVTGRHSGCCPPTWRRAAGRIALQTQP